MRVLISLVGEQPAPNLIPLFAEAYDRVQFMVSSDSRIKDVAGFLENAIFDDPSLKDIVKVTKPHFPMNAWELNRAREDCERVIRKHKEAGDDVVVNLTGGTKIMSLAAYQAAKNCQVPMLYVNTEQRTLIHFSKEGNLQEAIPFKVKIPIQTQLRAVGREFNLSKPPVQPEDIPPALAEFAHQIIFRYDVAFKNLIQKVIQQAGGAGRAVSFVPQGQSREIAQKAHDLGLWQWNQTEETITVINSDAYKYLNGGWVEIFALTTLAKDSRFDEVLGNVKVEGFEGEIDVIVSCNGRLGIVECKTKSPEGEGMTFAVAKIRLHEIIFGGTYAKAIYALPADIDHKQKIILRQYRLPEPIFGDQLKNIGDKVASMLNA